MICSHKWIGYALCLFLIIVSFGCSRPTHYQVVQYENPWYSSVDPIVPGVEPEESRREFMILAKGKGLEPAEGTPQEKRLMAERAAVMDGYRKLAERLGGVILRAHTQTGNNTVTMEQVMAETRAYLRGAHATMVEFRAGIAMADVRVYIEPRLYEYYDGKP